MTAEAQTKKDFFDLGGGLNTELNELNFPDGYTTDEANYELLVDGSRRRRKGLAAESGQGAADTTAVWTSSEFNQVYLWKNAGGDPSSEIMVFRKGNILHFADSDETISGGWYDQTVALEPYETSGSTTANTDDVALTFAQGRGYLFVAGPFLQNLYIEFDGTSAFTVSPIAIKIRDYTNIEDGVNYAEEPTGTISADHRYNLRNRGWKQTDMDQFDTDLSKHPAKNAIPHKGYKRTYGSSIFEKDGTRSWDSTKMDAEAFGSSSAPIGSLFLEVLDTTVGFGIGGSGGQFAITNWTLVDGGATWTLTLTTSAAHGLTPTDTFTVIGQKSLYSFEHTVGEPDFAYWDFNGAHTATTGTTGSTAKMVVTQPPDWDSSGAWVTQFLQYGSVDSDSSLVRSNGTAHTDSTAAVEFHAGRVFYAGMQNQEFADYVFYSQIVDGAEKIPRCFQEADPTDENINSLVSSDGGTIVVPGMSGVQNLISTRNSLIIIAKEGVWELSGGQRGVFTADGFSVRKLSDQGGNSPTGVISIENAVVYTGPGGIFLISPNEFTGLLEVKSISEQTVQTLWNQIPDAEQIRLQMAYDNALRRIYFMYGPDGTTVGIDTMLIFDARAGGWYKYTFDQPSDNELLTGFAISNADDTSDNKKMKFLYKASTTTVNVADFDQTTFNDWDGTNGPLPFLATGHDKTGSWQSRKQAPIITVYSKNTVTGFTANGDDWDADNESSTTMTPYWDWTNDTITNKIGTGQEVYRYVRNFTPSSTSQLDGYPVVVTRNKVRGRGRALQLRFAGATDKDSHILGFTTNYKISRKK